MSKKLTARDRLRLLRRSTNANLGWARRRRFLVGRAEAGEVDVVASQGAAGAGVVAGLAAVAAPETHKQTVNKLGGLVIMIASNAPALWELPACVSGAVGAGLGCRGG